MSSIGEKLEFERKRQALTLRELAARAGVSASMLCSIEKGRVNPSVSTLFEISNALAVHPQYFFVKDSGEETPAVPTIAPAAPLVGIAQQATDPRPSPAVVTRASLPTRALTRDARATLQLTHGVEWSLLTPQPDPAIEFMEIVYPGGSSSGSEMFSHPGREFGVILEGEALIEVGFERFPLKKGDSIAFESTTPHRISNPSKGPMRAIWVNHKTG